MTQSGLLDKKIKIFKKVNVVNDEGFGTWTHELIASPWAKVHNVTEQVEVDSQKEGVSKERVTFEIYYRPGITKMMSIDFRNKKYQITAIYNPEFKDEMLILTGERNDSLEATTI